MATGNKTRSVCNDERRWPRRVGRREKKTKTQKKKNINSQQKLQRLKSVYGPKSNFRNRSIEQVGTEIAICSSCPQCRRHVRQLSISRSQKVVRTNWHHLVVATAGGTRIDKLKVLLRSRGTFDGMSGET